MRAVGSRYLVGFGERANRMARVTAPVLTPHIIDHCIRPLQLNLQCSDERVFGLDNDVFGLFHQRQSNSILHVSSPRF